MHLPTTSFGAHSLAVVIVVAWALGAVFMLTRTLVAANAIDGNVVTIREEVRGIDDDLDFVELALTTGSVADDIEAAAAPLSGQLDQVIDAAEDIDANAVSILGTAQLINGSVKDINTTALAINKTVKSINANAAAINRNANAINANAREINASVLSINAHAVGINGSVNSINGNLGGVLGVVVSINGDDTAPLAQDLGISGINRRADIIIDLVQSIKADTGNILVVVRDDIVKHANSIDCSSIVQAAGLIGPGGDGCDS